MFILLQPSWINADLFWKQERKRSGLICLFLWIGENCTVVFVPLSLFFFSLLLLLFYLSFFPPHFLFLLISLLLSPSRCVYCCAIALVSWLLHWIYLSVALSSWGSTTYLWKKCRCSYLPSSGLFLQPRQIDPDNFWQQERKRSGLVYLFLEIGEKELHDICLLAIVLLGVHCCIFALVGWMLHWIYLSVALVEVPLPM